MIPAPLYKFCPFCASELQTRFDEDRERKVCLQCHWIYYPHVAVSVAGILLDGNRVLLVKRRHKPCQGTWMFPSGFVEYGEHPVEALLREFAEETGLTVQDPKWLGIFQSEDDPREPGHFALFYEIGTWHGELRNDPRENDGVEWFDLHNLPLVGLKLHVHFLAERAKRSEQPSTPR